MSDDPARLMRFILELRQSGVTDARVLAAMERTPRVHYAPEHLEALAMDDLNLPLAHGQMMTKPSVVGRMLTALNAQSHETILEIGTGSGYQSAALGWLARKVVTLDRYEDLIATARESFGLARLGNVFAHVGDGAKGWAEDSPYDRIMINAEITEIPLDLVAQLKPDGVVVAPVGGRLRRLRGETREDLGPIDFAPLAEGIGDTD